MNYVKLVLMLLVAMSMLTVSTPANSEQGKFSIGGYGGWVTSIVGEAVKGYEKTDFKSSGAYGGSMLYRFPSGLAIELTAEHYGMDLEELNEDLGTLKMTPVMLLVKYQGFPENGKGFAGHAGIGAGKSFNSYDKGAAIADLESKCNCEFTVDVDDSFVAELCGGMDYFINEHFSISLDGRLLIGNVKTEWAVSGSGSSVTFDDIDTYHTSNFQALLGARVWF